MHQHTNQNDAHENYLMKSPRICDDEERFEKLQSSRCSSTVSGMVTIPKPCLSSNESEDPSISEGSLLSPISSLEVSENSE